MRTLLLAAAAAANLAAPALARASEPAAAPPAAQAEARPAVPAKGDPTPSPGKPAQAGPDLKVAPAPEANRAAAGSSRVAPPKAPEAKPCEPVKPCTID